MKPAAFLLGALVCLAAACASGEDDGMERMPRRAGGEAMGVPRIAADSYAVAPVTGTTVQVLVRLEGPPPPDTTVQARSISPACSTSFVDTAVSVGAAREIRGALVWLEGVRRGPADTTTRRATLVIGGCQLRPRLSILPVGGALQVMTSDSVVDTIVVTSTTGTADTLPFSQAGQLVPVARRVQRAGLLQLQSTRLPWMRAMVALAPTPFWRLSDSVGVVTFTDVPVGARVTVRAWHPALRPTSVPLTVSRGGAPLTLSLRR